MAKNTRMNSQITDAVSQSNLQTLGSAPAGSMGMLYQMLAQSTGMSMQNLVANQQHKNSIGSAVITGAVSTLLSLNTATNGKATTHILRANPVAQSLAATKAVNAAFGTKFQTTPAFNH